MTTESSTNGPGFSMDDELLDIASKLESGFDSDAACSQLSGEKPWLCLTGNRDALLKIATALLRAAAAPIPDDESRSKPTFIEHRQINVTNTDYVLVVADRIDSFPENPAKIARRKHRAWANDRIGLIGCGLVGFVVLSLLLSGIVFWWFIFSGTPLR